MISTENLQANDIEAFLKTITKEEQDELLNHCKKITKRKKKLKEKKTNRARTTRAKRSKCIGSTVYSDAIVTFRISRPFKTEATI
jgi:hypothetical protein